MTRRLVQDTPGSTDHLHLVEEAEQHAGPGQVRIRVRAGAVNPIDWKLATGMVPARAMGLSFPLGFGGDITGTVDEVGDGVTGFAVGDRVLGGRVGTGFGDVVVGTPGELDLHHVPDGIDDATAAGLSTPARAAVAMVDALGDIDGATVLVGGGSGSVGSIAVQYAVARGAHVIATGSERNAGFLRSLGSQPVTYGEGLGDRVRDLAPQGLDAAADAHGTEAVEVALALGVAPRRVAAIAGGPVPEGVQTPTALQARPDAVDDVLGRVARDEMTVRVARTFPLDQYPRAVELSMGGHAGGRVVLTVR